MNPVESGKELFDLFEELKSKSPSAEDLDNYAALTVFVTYLQENEMTELTEAQAIAYAEQHPDKVLAVISNLEVFLFRLNSYLSNELDAEEEIKAEATHLEQSAVSSEGELVSGSASPIFHMDFPETARFQKHEAIRELFKSIQSVNTMIAAYHGKKIDDISHLQDLLDQQQNKIQRAALLQSTLSELMNGEKNRGFAEDYRHFLKKIKLNVGGMKNQMEEEIARTAMESHREKELLLQEIDQAFPIDSLLSPAFQQSLSQYVHYLESIENSEEILRHIRQYSESKFENLYPEVFYALPIAQCYAIHEYALRYIGLVQKAMQVIANDLQAVTEQFLSFNVNQTAIIDNRLVAEFVKSAKENKLDYKEYVNENPDVSYDIKYAIQTLMQAAQRVNPIKKRASVVEDDEEQKRDVMRDIKDNIERARAAGAEQAAPSLTATSLEDDLLSSESAPAEAAAISSASQPSERIDIWKQYQDSLANKPFHSLQDDEVIDPDEEDANVRVEAQSPVQLDDVTLEIMKRPEFSQLIESLKEAEIIVKHSTDLLVKSNAEAVKLSQTDNVATLKSALVIFKRAKDASDTIKQLLRDSMDKKIIFFNAIKIAYAGNKVFNKKNIYDAIQLACNVDFEKRAGYFGRTGDKLDANIWNNIQKIAVSNHLAASSKYLSVQNEKFALKKQMIQFTSLANNPNSADTRALIQGVSYQAGQINGLEKLLEEYKGIKKYTDALPQEDNKLKAAVDAQITRIIHDIGDSYLAGIKVLTFKAEQEFAEFQSRQQQLNAASKESIKLTYGNAQGIGQGLKKTLSDLLQLSQKAKIYCDQLPDNDPQKKQVQLAFEACQAKSMVVQEALNAIDEKLKPYQWGSWFKGMLGGNQSAAAGSVSAQKNSSDKPPPPPNSPKA
jgi:hypothetical protein